MYRLTAGPSILKKCADRISRAVFLIVSIFIPALFLSPMKASAQEASALGFISDFASGTGRNLLFVSKDEIPGVFNTITEAALAASDGDVIVIFPGEYEESLDLRGRDLILWGTDSASCVIKYDTSRYTTPVLNISSGIFGNLTIYGYRGNAQPLPGDASTAVISPDNLDDFYSGYAIHIDDDREYGRSVSFSNCTVISENSNCIGIGLRDHFTASFDACNFISTGLAGILYVHDPDTVLFAGTDMHLIFRNNIWKSYGSPYAVYTKSIYYGNRTELTFQNVISYVYASDSYRLYSPFNSYSGPDVRMLLAAEPGTVTTPIYRYVVEKRSNGIAALRKDTDCVLPGIYYIEVAGTKEESSVPFIAAPYFVTNPYDIPGDGWAGSATFYLSADSFGNTLGEMNYLK